MAGSLEADLAQQDFIGALTAIGGSAGNGRLRELLEWSDTDDERVKAALMASGQIRAGRGQAAPQPWPTSPWSRHKRHPPSAPRTKPT